MQNACLTTGVIATSKIATKVTLYSQFDSVKQFSVLRD